MKIKYEANVNCDSSCRFFDWLNPANHKKKRCCTYDHTYCAVEKSLLEKRPCPIEVKDMEVT